MLKQLSKEYKARGISIKAMRQSSKLDKGERYPYAARKGENVKYANVYL